MYWIAVNDSFAALALVT